MNRKLSHYIVCEHQSNSFYDHQRHAPQQANTCLMDAAQISHQPTRLLGYFQKFSQCPCDIEIWNHSNHLILKVLIVCHFVKKRWKKLKQLIPTVLPKFFSDKWEAEFVFFGLQIIGSSPRGAGSQESRHCWGFSHLPTHSLQNQRTVACEVSQSFTSRCLLSENMRQSELKRDRGNTTANTFDL